MCVLCALAAVPQLEVWDTSELDSLQDLFGAERNRLAEERQLAKEQQRKVLRVNCELDMKRIDKINGFVEHVRKDKRRTW